MEKEFTSLLLMGVMAIERCDGTRTFAKTEGLFVKIDPAFYGHGLYKSGVATDGTLVKMQEIIQQEGSLERRQVFLSLSTDLDSLCFSQNQIVIFMEKYKRLLPPDYYSNFFLCKKEGHSPAEVQNLFFVDIQRADTDEAESFCVRFASFEEERGLLHPQRIIIPSLIY